MDFKLLTGPSTEGKGEGPYGDDLPKFDALFTARDYAEHLTNPQQPENLKDITEHLLAVQKTALSRGYVIDTLVVFFAVKEWSEQYSAHWIPFSFDELFDSKLLEVV